MRVSQLRPAVRSIAITTDSSLGMLAALWVVESIESK